FTVSDESDWIYNGGFYLISTMTLLIIASVVHPTTILAKLLGNPVFVYIGKRSYSLYLWHFPIMSFVHSYFIDGQMPMYVYILDIILTVLFAELSFKYVETPLRKQGFKAFAIKKTYKPQFIRTIVTLVILLPTIFILIGVFDKFGKDTISNKAQTFNTDEADQYLIHMIPIDNISLTSDGKTKANTKDNDVYTQIKPLLIGDSVMVDIGEQFKTKVPKAKIDGKVGRQLYTNGDFTKEQLDQLIGKFGKAQVYLVNTRVPRSYENHVNTLMAEAAKDKKNVTLIDWYSRSKGHTEYFAPDGIHLENDGVEALTDEILKSIKKK
ncbi:MAG: acyltransferase family protein, partial [Staphylococcus epidermidis]|nr:acyltransferase family protein [Staphylococcus epidermidis]